MAIIIIIIMGTHHPNLAQAPLQIHGNAQVASAGYVKSTR
jgi:hypothetical protein